MSYKSGFYKGRLGIGLANSGGDGTGNPRFPLDVNGDIRLTGSLLRSDGTPYLGGGLINYIPKGIKSILNNDGSYYIGFGSHTPTEALDISGNLKVSGQILSVDGDNFSTVVPITQQQTTTENPTWHGDVTTTVTSSSDATSFATIASPTFTGMVTIPELKLTGQLYESDGVTPRIFSNWTLPGGADAGTSHIYRNSQVTIGSSSANTSGYKLFVNGTTSINGAIRAGFDNDIISYFGRTWIGHVGGLSDHAGIGHIDHMASGEYAIMVANTGKTYLGSVNNQSIGFRIGNSDKMELTSGGILKIQSHIEHSGDTDTKFGFPNNNEFEVRVGGNSMIATSGGNVQFKGASNSGWPVSIPNGGMYSYGTINASTLTSRGDITAAQYIVHQSDTDCKFGFNANDNFSVVTADDTRLQITNSYSYIYNALQISNKIYHYNNTSCWFGFPSNNTITFNTASVESMRIDSAGNVGIGVPAPGYKLEVSGIVRATSGFSGGASSAFSGISNSGTITSSGGSKFTYTGYTASVNYQSNYGAVKSYYDHGDRTNYYHAIDETNHTYSENVNIDVSVIEVAKIIFFSDKRIKTNIVDVPDDLSLQKVRNIPCRHYNYRDSVKYNNTNKTIGFIAQEVEEVFPEAISKEERIIPNLGIFLTNELNTNLFSWNYDNSKNKWKMTIPTINDLIIDSSDNVYEKCKAKFIVNTKNLNDYNKEINNLSGNLIEINKIKQKYKSTEKELILEIEDDLQSFIFDEKWDTVFLYGVEVQDFCAIDKNKLFALNFSATQEIDRQQQADKAEIAELKTEVATLKSELVAIKAHLGI